MAGQLEQQQAAKREKLLGAGRELFLQKGAAKTSVEELTAAAGVAKGTFYLYYHDKEALLQEVVYQLTREVTARAHAHAARCSQGDFVEDVLCFADYVLREFEARPDVLALVERNFCWMTLGRQLREGGDELLAELARACVQNPYMARRTPEEVYHLISMVLSLCGSVAYSAILFSQPDTLDHLRPTLFEAIRRMLQ